MTDRKKFEIEYSRTFSESSFDYSGELESVFSIGDDGEYQDQCTRAAFDGWCIAWQAATKAAVPKWIPVTERLPDVGELILVYDETDFYGHIYTIKTCERTILRMRGDVPHYTKVTHWMPLPAAPEVK